MYFINAAPHSPFPTFVARVLLRGDCLPRIMSATTSESSRPPGRSDLLSQWGGQSFKHLRSVESQLPHQHHPPHLPRNISSLSLSFPPSLLIVPRSIVAIMSDSSAQQPSATSSSQLGAAPRRIRNREDQIESAYILQRVRAFCPVPLLSSRA